MYLSKLILNVRHPGVMRAIADVYRMHQLIWRGFPDQAEGGPGRILYRVDPARAGQMDAVLVQSEKEPDWTEFCSPNGPFCCAQSKEITPKFVDGMRLQFLMRANPTVLRLFPPKPGEPEPKQKRIGLYLEAEQRAWLTGEWKEGSAPDWIARRQSKSDLAGFCVEDLRVDSPGKVFGKKPDGTRLEFQVVEYRGTLTIQDMQAFLQAFEGGIGSGKGFGFGLLSVART